MTRLFTLMGKFALFIAGMAALTLMFLFVGGGYLITLPVMKMSPRNRRLTALIGAGTALITLARAYGLDRLTETEPATDVPEATEGSREYPYEEGDAIILGPACFVARDGSVLNWRGQNFIPQDLTNAARLTGFVPDREPEGGE